MSIYEERAAEMTNHFVKLNCGNCGGELDVYDDMERFFCGHCGTEMTVERRGGTIALKSATGPVNKPAGPALMRLKEEAGNLSKRLEATQTEWIEKKKRGFIIGILLFLIGVVVVRSGYGFVTGLGVMLAGIFTISYIRRNDKRVLADVRELQTKIDVLNGRIEDHSYQPS